MNSWEGQREHLLIKLTFRLSQSFSFSTSENRITSEAGFAYFLVGTKDALSIYVGQTSDLRRRLCELNPVNSSCLPNQPHKTMGPPLLRNRFQ